jgi:hypothetical protein
LCLCVCAGGRCRGDIVVDGGGSAVRGPEGRVLLVSSVSLAGHAVLIARAGLLSMCLSVHAEVYVCNGQQAR